MNLDLAGCHWVSTDLQPSGDKSENISPAIFLEMNISQRMEVVPQKHRTDLMYRSQDAFKNSWMIFVQVGV